MLSELMFTANVSDDDDDDDLDEGNNNVTLSDRFEDDEVEADDLIAFIKCQHMMDCARNRGKRECDFIYTKKAARPRFDSIYAKNSARLRSNFIYTNFF